MQAFKQALIAASLLISSLSFAQDPGDPPASVARLSYLTGDVSLQAYGTDDWSLAPPNYPMIGGDRVYTAQSSRAVLQLSGAELRIGQGTDVTLTNLADQYDQLALAQGSVHLRVFALDPGSQIEVDTPNGAVIVESPGDYRIDADQASGSSDLIVLAGNALIAGPGVNQPLSSGYAMQMFGANPIQLQYTDFPQYDALDSWSAGLDQRYRNSISARYVSPQMVGYADLDANGSWQPDTEYGPVWFPNSVPDGWRPYSTGHWAYVAPWGYTWVDDAPWGFAPFHYGRWTQVEGRWGWTPGPPRVRPVYSPALVAFVGGNPGGGGLSIGINFGGGGGGVAAWFPIGVGEPYVPWYRCSPTYARRVNTSNVNTTVIRNTTIVNNYNTYITNVHVTNTTNVVDVHDNHFNYANRASVTAVPVAAMSSGTSVARQQVRLSPQQTQQLAQAPISVRPTAPAPATPHPSLVAARANVPIPAARPTVMTTTGQSRAVPSPAHTQPVAVNRLPPPRVVPQNAAPAAVQRPAPAPGLRPGQPAETPTHSLPTQFAARPSPATASPAITRPSSPPASNPASIQRPAPAGQTAPVQRPNNPASETRPATIAPAAPVTRPVQPAPAAPVTRPATAAPAAPATRPLPPAQTRPNPSTVAPAQPGRVTQPETQHPSTVTPMPRPATQNPASQPAPPVTRPLPAPQARPATPEPTKPQVAPAKPAPAKPASKDEPKPKDESKTKDEPKPKDEPK